MNRGRLEEDEAIRQIRLCGIAYLPFEAYPKSWCAVSTALKRITSVDKSYIAQGELASSKVDKWFTCFGACGARDGQCAIGYQRKYQRDREFHSCHLVAVEEHEFRVRTH